MGIVAVHVTPVKNDTKKLRHHIHIDTFQLACLELRSFVIVQGQIAQSLELDCLQLTEICWSHSCEELNPGGYLALVREKLHLTQVNRAVKLQAYLLWEVAMSSSLPSLRLLRMGQQFGNGKVWLL